MSPCPAACVTAALALTLAGAAQQHQTAALVPAGPINAAAAQGPYRLVCEDDDAVARYATALRDKRFAGAEVVRGEVPAERLAGHTLLVWATPEHPLLRAHAAALPFAWTDGAVTVDGRTFRGKRLRLIAAVRNPADPARRAVLYTAAKAADLVESNAVFHGPTEWTVADGTTVLGAGSFLHGITLSPDAMRRDLDTLLATLREVHPATADGVPPALDAAFTAARERTSTPLDRLAFGRVLAETVVPLHDAHTTVALPRSGERVDLPLVWLAEGPVVTADTAALRRGDRLVALAGVAAGELLRRVASVVSAENGHWVRHHAPSLLADRGALAALGIDAALPVRARVERDGTERDVELGAAAPPPRAKRPEWVRFTIDAERSLGVFTLDRCTVDEQYRRTLADFFAAVRERKVRRIAIDLRENGGGNSQVANEFLRHLGVHEYRDFSGDVRWSAPVFAQRGGRGAPRVELAKPQRRRNARVDEPFGGEVLVLIGPGTFSSGTWFATVLRDNDLARLVGEPTGGAPSGYGDVLSFTLPESGASHTVSWKRWIRPDPARDPATTLAPDELVARTRASIAAGTDPVLDWLRAR
jgi:hypothetical protein